MINFDSLIGRQVVVRNDTGTLLYPFTAVTDITVDATQTWTEGIASLLGHFGNTNYIVTVVPNYVIELVGANSLL